MPRGDRKGPAGQGAKTGRGMGFCAGYSEPGFTANLAGRGFGGGFGGGFGRGFGRGFGGGWGAGFRGAIGGRWDNPALTADETLGLEQQIQQLREQIASLETRLTEKAE